MSGVNGVEVGYVYGEVMGRGWLFFDEMCILYKYFCDGEWNKYCVIVVGLCF